MLLIAGSDVVFFPYIRAEASWSVCRTKHESAPLENLKFYSAQRAEIALVGLLRTSLEKMVLFMIVRLIRIRSMAYRSFLTQIVCRTCWIFFWGKSTINLSTWKSGSSYLTLSCTVSCNLSAHIEASHENIPNKCVIFKLKHSQMIVLKFYLNPWQYGN